VRPEQPVWKFDVRAEPANWSPGADERSDDVTECHSFSKKSADSIVCLCLGSCSIAGMLFFEAGQAARNRFRIDAVGGHSQSYGQIGSLGWK
jgi:hypothetical protein